MDYNGICHGTLGELIQGPFIHQGELRIGIVSLPIRKYSRVSYTMGAPGNSDVELQAKPRCRQAIALYLDHHGKTLPPGRWHFASELPQGKGMASSTADIVATLRCLDALFDVRSSPTLVASILRRIERSDSVFLSEYALYLSDRQEVIRQFPGDPKFHACYIDEGYAVDTEATTALLRQHYTRRLDAYLDNLEQTIDAFGRQDLTRIAACATRSAVLSQEVLPKRHLQVMLDNQSRFAAAGILVAHTGSIVGYIYLERPPPATVNELEKFFADLGHRAELLQTGF